jgi:hypothetical protein
MHHRLTHIVAGGLVLLTTAVASAGIVSTPALQRDGAHRLVCVVSNIGSKVITVLSADVVDDLTGSPSGGSSTVGLLPECTQAVLPPGTSCSSPVSTNGNNPRIGHCVVTFEGSKKSVRAALWVVDGLFPHNLVGPVVPAN